MNRRPTYDERCRRATRPDLWPRFRGADVAPLPRRRPVAAADPVTRFVDGVLDTLTRPAVAPAVAADYGLVR